MATSKKIAKKSAEPAVRSLKISWKQLLIMGSVAANIGFVVLFTAMAATPALDRMLMHEGLGRYCSSTNDSKFDGSEIEVKAMRDYTCARDDAKEYFARGFNEYLKFRESK